MMADELQDGRNPGSRGKLGDGFCAAPAGPAHHGLRLAMQANKELI
jgi:hypothetical protein